MNITFESLEQAKSKIAEHEALCKEYNQQRAVARKEVEDAKAKVANLTDRQVEGENVLDELGRAVGFVSVAEEKQKRLISKIGLKNPSLELKGIGNIHNFKREIRDTALDSLKVELEVLEIAKKQYLEAAEKALIKYYALYRKAEAAQKEWLGITEEQRPFDLEAITIGDLRPALWVNSADYINEFYLVREKASNYK